MEEEHALAFGDYGVVLDRDDGVPSLPPIGPDLDVAELQMFNRGGHGYLSSVCRLLSLDVVGLGDGIDFLNAHTNPGRNHDRPRPSPRHPLDFHADLAPDTEDQIFGVGEEDGTLV